MHHMQKIFTHIGIAIGANRYNIMMSPRVSYDIVGLALISDAMMVKVISSSPQNFHLHFLHRQTSKVEATTPSIELPPANTTPYLVLQPSERSTITTIQNNNYYA